LENDNTFGGLVGPDFFVVLPPSTVIPFPANTAGLRIDRNESVAAYAQADWRFNDKASVTLGLRYTHERKQTNNHGDSFLPSVAPTAEIMEQLFGQGFGYAPSGFEAAQDWDSVTPRVAFNYQFSPSVLGYISAAEGFKSGGFNGRITTSAQEFDPETLWSYEAGLKTSFAGGGVLNLAAFYQDYKDMQVSRFASDPVTGNFTSVFDNAGGATMYGVEAELSAPITSQLRLDSNLAYLHSEYTEFVDGGVDVSDQRHLVNAPEWSGRLGLRYQQPLGDFGDLTLSAGASYRSRTYLTVSSNQALSQGAYTLYDASIMYEPPGGRWNILLSGENLSDVAYRDHAFDLSASPGVLLGYYGAPLTYSLTVRYQF
jgi:iron complex outermembrane receptor protein